MSRNIFKKSIVALAIPAALMSTTVTAAQLEMSKPVFDEATMQVNTRPTSFIIKFKSNVATAALNSTDSKTQAAFLNAVTADINSISGQAFTHKRPMSLANHHVFNLSERLSAKQVSKVMALVSKNSNVEFIEENKLMQPLATPNDSQYSNQWHYFEATGGLNVPSAWDKVTGSGVTVAVLDTGYRPHADLNANILAGYDMISDSSIGNDGNGRDSDARDTGDAVSANECGYTHSARTSSWHGTHVAGTVAAVTNNNAGVAGVAYGAKVVPVRVLGKCGGTTADIADAIVWASGGSVSGVPANQNPADVINMSLGGSGSCSSTSQSAINTARANGAAIVVAAGNDNDNVSKYNPGNCSGVITVAATGRNGGRAYYSNYGNLIDVAAPGGAQSFANDPEGVLSTMNSGTGSPSSDSYSYSQGTSMAAPHVAGVAALIKEAKPNATPDQIETILKDTARSFPATCSQCGTGIVDANAAVDEALGSGGNPPGGSNELTDGVAKTSLSGASGSQTNYTMSVPSSASTVTFTMSGGSGDADLYVRFGSAPTSSSYDCRPYKGGNSETCSFDPAQAGTYHVMLVGYSAYSGVSLLGDYEESQQSGGSGSRNNLSASRNSWVYETLSLPSGAKNLQVSISGGSGDADLYTRDAGTPTTSSYDCRPYKTGNTESCSAASPSAGNYYIGIRAYSAFSGLSLNWSYE